MCEGRRGADGWPVWWVVWVCVRRELALQIHDVLGVFTTEYPQLRCMLFVGGTSVVENANDFVKHGGQVVIGTPGRILDVTNRTAEVNWKKLEILVLDEADKLLDMGFRESLNQIFSMLPKQRRTGLFSATQTKEVKELARAGLRNPVSVSVRVQHKAKATALPTGGNATDAAAAATSSGAGGSSSSSALAAIAIPQATPTTLDNWYMVREYDARVLELVRFIRQHRTSKVIVFCATCACVDYYSLAIPQLLKALGGGATSSSSSSGAAATEKKLTIVGFHGKMVAKKRTLVYQKFKHVDSGVMFSTDVAARGLDLPDVDWIVQLAAPKDPAFFVHRVGRTARAGRKGGALLFITPEEEAYVELLRGRGVPLRCAAELSDLAPVDDVGATQPATAQTATVPSDKPPSKKKQKQAAATEATAPSSSSSSSAAATDATATGDATIDLAAVLTGLKGIAKRDRDALEKGSTAFMSFVRAYKEHLCSFIFRLEFLDLGAVARSYGLLRLPKMAETRGVKGKPIVFETDAIDTSTIAYKHTEKEAARVRKLQQSLAAEAAAEEADDLGSVNSGDSNRGQIIPLSTRSVRSMRSTRSSRTGKTGKTGTKTVWVPSEQFERKDEKRERGKKKSATAKLREEWEDLAAEEGLFKKFKKGKLTKEKYDETLTSAERQAKEAWDEVDAENQRANGRKRRRDDDSDDSDFDGGDSGSEGGSDFDGDDMDSD